MLKGTKGIIRKVDELGRIVLPAEQRESLGIQEGMALAITASDGKITLQIAERYCSLCDNTGELLPFLDKHICPDCVKAIKQMG